MVRESGREALRSQDQGDPLAKAWGRQRSPQNSSLDPGSAATFLPRLRLETETFRGVEGRAGRHHSLWLQRASQEGFSLFFPGWTVLPEEAMVSNWSWMPGPGQARPEAAEGQGLCCGSSLWASRELPGGAPIISGHFETTFKTPTEDSEEGVLVALFPPRVWSGARDTLLCLKGPARGWPAADPPAVCLRHIPPLVFNSSCPQKGVWGGGRA